MVSIEPDRVIPEAPESPIQSRSQTCSADICCPQSFKERVLTIMCVSAAEKATLACPLHRVQAASVRAAHRKSAGVVFLAPLRTQPNPLTPRHLPHCPESFRLALNTKFGLGSFLRNPCGQNPVSTARDAFHQQGLQLCAKAFVWPCSFAAESSAHNILSPRALL